MHQFELDNLPGVTFTIVYDPEAQWLTLDGIRADGSDHVSAGLRVERD